MVISVTCLFSQHLELNRCKECTKCVQNLPSIMLGFEWKCEWKSISVTYQWLPITGCLLTTCWFPLIARITLETPYTFHTCIQSQEYSSNRNSVWRWECISVGVCNWDNHSKVKITISFFLFNSEELMKSISLCIFITQN